MTSMREAMAKAVGPQKLDVVKWHMKHTCKKCNLRPMYKRKMCFQCNKEAARNGE